MTPAPRVSIVMSAYNAAAHIDAAIECLMRQTTPDWELIVVDDGSSDDTAQAVAAWVGRDARIQYHAMPRNLGPSAARNIGFGLARGDWITILDSDDRYEADRLTVLLESAERLGADIVADNLELFDEAVGAVVSSGFSFSGDQVPLTPRRLLENDGPPRIASLGHLKPFIRRAFWKTSGVRYPEDVRISEDFYFLFLLLQKTQRAFLLKYAGYRYTMPFSAVSGRQASGTRTDYSADGLEHLGKINAMLASHVRRTEPPASVLHTLLDRRGTYFGREGDWRRTKRHVRNGEFLDAARLLSKMEPPFLWAQIEAIARRRAGLRDTVLR